MTEWPAMIINIDKSYLSNFDYVSKYIDVYGEGDDRAVFMEDPGVHTLAII